MFEMSNFSTIHVVSHIDHKDKPSSLIDFRITSIEDLEQFDKLQRLQFCINILLYSPQRIFSNIKLNIQKKSFRRKTKMFSIINVQ